MSTGRTLFESVCVCLECRVREMYLPEGTFHWNAGLFVVILNKSNIAPVTSLDLL